MDPADRIAKPADLARPLRTLEERRAVIAGEAETQRLNEQRVARADPMRAAQPFLYGMLGVVLPALLASLWAFGKARQQQRIATGINHFLTDDPLRLNNPDVGSGVSQALNQAIERAVSEIDQRFAHEPAVAASVHDTIAFPLTTRAISQAGPANTRLARSTGYELRGRSRSLRF